MPKFQEARSLPHARARWPVRLTPPGGGRMTIGPAAALGAGDGRQSRNPGRDVLPIAAIQRSFRI